MKKLLVENIIPMLIALAIIAGGQWMVSSTLEAVKDKPAALTPQQRCVIRLIEAGETEAQIEQRCTPNGEAIDGIDR